MKNLVKIIIGIIVAGSIISACSTEEKAVGSSNKTVVKTNTDQYDDTTKYGCRHFKSLIANADVTTYAEQLKEMKTVYTAMAVAYEDGNYQSGPMYSAARIAYSASIDNYFNEEAIKAMAELQLLCAKVPNW